MRCKRNVIGYNIETGERREWRSLSVAAEEIGATYSYLAHLTHDKASIVKGWAVAYPEYEADAVSLYENGGRKERDCRRSKRMVKAPNKGTVPLVLKNKTVIWVKPEQATKEFAENYLKMLEENNY